jgi:hypothetical protein
MNRFVNYTGEFILNVNGQSNNIVDNSVVEDMIVYGTIGAVVLFTVGVVGLKELNRNKQQKQPTVTRDYIQEK